MLEARSANLMELAAVLPRAAERVDMRFQWIWRVLMNRLISPDEVMAPFAVEGSPLSSLWISRRSTIVFRS
jgi:hypothetical protein